MPWASGAFSRIFGSSGWTDDRNAGTKIVSGRHDTHDQDISDGINQCLTRDNAAKPTSNFLADGDLARDLGSSSVRWRAVYSASFLDSTNNDFLGSSGTTAVVSGGSGWTAGSIRTAGVERIAYSASLINLKATAVQVNGARIFAGQTAFKPATTARTLTTTFTDDPDLIVPLTAGFWSVEMFAPLWGTTSGAQGIKLGITYSGGINSSSLAFGGVINAIGFQNQPIALGNSFAFATITVSSGPATSPDWVGVNGIVNVSGSGNLSFLWTQNSSSANATNVGIGWLRAQRLTLP